MQIEFTPQRSDLTLTIEVHDDVLTINGEAFDFAALEDGALLPRDAVSCDWLASDVERIAGELHLTLILPHGAYAPPETLFPQPLSVVADGPVQLPAHAAEANP